MKLLRRCWGFEAERAYALPVSGKECRDMFGVLDRVALGYEQTGEGGKIDTCGLSDRGPRVDRSMYANTFIRWMS